MNRPRYFIPSLLIIATLIVGFLLSVPHTRDSGQKKSLVVAPAALRVSVHDVFKKGTHTISGSVLAPNACSVVSAQASLREAASSSVIMLALQMPSDTDLCLQVPTPLAFSTTLAAPAALPLEVTVNGTPASTTLQ